MQVLQTEISGNDQPGNLNLQRAQRGLLHHAKHLCAGGPLQMDVCCGLCFRISALELLECCEPLQTCHYFEIHFASMLVISACLCWSFPNAVSQSEISDFYPRHC